jgi:hypothetical protein
MRYMRDLNEWLERDVHDRQAEIRGVTARVDQLRNDVGRMGGMRPPGTLFLLTTLLKLVIHVTGRSNSRICYPTSGYSA